MKNVEVAPRLVLGKSWGQTLTLNDTNELNVLNERNENYDI